MSYDPRRVWRYQFPDEDVTKTEAQILTEYFPYWSFQMRRVGKEHLISYTNCIEDWVTIHWAQEVKVKDL